MAGMRQRPMGAMGGMAPLAAAAAVALLALPAHASGSEAFYRGAWIVINTIVAVLWLGLVWGIAGALPSRWGSWRLGVAACATLPAVTPVSNEAEVVWPAFIVFLTSNTFPVADYLGSLAITLALALVISASTSRASGGEPG